MVTSKLVTFESFHLCFYKHTHAEKELSMLSVDINSITTNYFPIVSLKLVLVCDISGKVVTVSVSANEANGWEQQCCHLVSRTGVSL